MILAKYKFNIRRWAPDVNVGATHCFDQLGEGPHADTPAVAGIRLA